MIRRRPSDTIARALGIATVIVLMGTLVVVIGQALAERKRPVGEAAAVVRGAYTERPVASAPGVWRGKGERLAALDAPLNGGAEPRRLLLYRSLRAYPGAPPRIPHGLTAEEFRVALCRSCHARGGYVARFGKYAPSTPHPEYQDCLSCHVPDGSKVGIGFPNPVDPVFCSQCHPAPDIRLAEFAPIDWRPAQWPTIGQRAFPEAPPLIPHDVESRSNCLACHAGPGAVQEIRTDHAERIDCLQCHLRTPPEGGDFQRR